MKKNKVEDVKAALSMNLTPVLLSYIEEFSPDSINALYNILFEDCNEYVEVCTVLEELDDMIISGWGISYQARQAIKNELDTLY